MSKKCGKCDKTVYPTEELKCLDKVWHKACFRCWECGMALNMKNYKGYEKKPYCNAHYPKTSFTAVSETPEMSRIAQNTKMQSQVKYHEDFERNIKGSKIQVADDPETLRIKASTNVISEVSYKGLKERTSEMEARRSGIQQPNDGGSIKRISDYDPSRVGGFKMAPVADQPTPAAPQQQATPNSGKNVGHSTVYSSQGGKVVQSGKRNVGSIADYDPVNENYGSLAFGYQPSKSVSQWEEVIDDSTLHNHIPPPHHQLPSRNSDSPHGVPPPQNEPSRRTPSPPRPAEEYHHPASQEYRPQDTPQQPAYTQEEYYPAPQHNLPPPQQPVQLPPQAQPPPPPQPEPVQPPPPADGGLGGISGPVYQAIYDYDAQDDDEVGFVDGDLIIDCQSIDDGWMFGTIRSTGKRGMLPANYVERVK